jgi:hypothetical protein
MIFQFDMTSTDYPSPEQVPIGPHDLAGLLRELLNVQREQLALQRNLLSAHDGGARWRAFLARWREDFPDLKESCRQAVPVLERTYSKLITEMTEQLCQSGSDSLENDFALQEFLDRYGMRLTQLGTILNMVAPLAEAGSPSEST